VRLAKTVEDTKDLRKHPVYDFSPDGPEILPAEIALKKKLNLNYEETHPGLFVGRVPRPVRGLQQKKR
jgi:hypothetical protein